MSDVKAERVHKEAQRRRAEEQARRDRLERVEREMLEATKQNRAIEAQWSQIAANNIPQVRVTD